MENADFVNVFVVSWYASLRVEIVYVCVRLYLERASGAVKQKEKPSLLKAICVSNDVWVLLHMNLISKTHLFSPTVFLIL